MNAPHGVFARQAAAGAPIEVLWWGSGSVNHLQFVSDDEALRLASDLTRMVHANMQAKARPEIVDGALHPAGEGRLVSEARMDDQEPRPVSRAVVGLGGERAAETRIGPTAEPLTS